VADNRLGFFGGISMSASSLRAKLNGGERVLGVCNTYPAAGVLESVGKGWDLVWIDGQHGQMGVGDLLNAVRAGSAMGVETVVRVASHEAGGIAAALDMAPSALMVPMVNTVEQARAVARASCFPPVGERSYGGRRVIDLFGRQFFESEVPVVMAQIETAEGAGNAAGIIGVEGIDLLFFGADDLKLSLGIGIDTPTTEDARVMAAMEGTAKAAKAAGKWCGCVAATAAVAKVAVSLGYQVLIGGADAGFLRSGSEEKLRMLKGVTT
jgi:2-keto-3-deoxy-L-rhamnonate aldolase RhmA